MHILKLCGESYEAIFNWLIHLAEQAVIVGELCVQSHKAFEDLWVFPKHNVIKCPFAKNIGIK